MESAKGVNEGEKLANCLRGKNFKLKALILLHKYEEKYKRSRFYSM